MPQPPSSLHAPISGRSRFSKALPSVPGLHRDAAAEPPLPLPPKDLPRLPQPPPSEVISMSGFNPSRSPLPPLPTPKTPGTLSTASPVGLPPSVKMAIPRRPVGKPSAALPVSPPVATPAAASTPAAPTPNLTAPAVEPEPHSPNDSLSSLLSAYSRSSDDLVLRSSDGTAGSEHVHVHVRDFDDASSPMTYETPRPHPPLAAGGRPDAAPTTQLPSQQKSLPQHLSTGSTSSYRGQPPEKSQSVTRKPAPTLDRSHPLPPPPPPPPSKDESANNKPHPPQPQSQQPSQRPASPPRPQQQHRQSPSIATPSPPRPQIWRRRSQKGSRELPNLKLDWTNGSTAATQPSAATPADPDPTPGPAAAPTSRQFGSPTPAALKTSPLPPPPAANGLPGRNIRPVPPKDSVDESQTMGHGTSKLKQLKDKLRSSHRSKGSSSSSKNDFTPRPSANRPPTPEYQKEDIKTPVVDTFISPVSPASSPEPGKVTSPNISKELPPEPPKLEPKIEQKPVARKALAPPVVHAAKSLSDLKVSTTTTPVTELPVPVPMRSAADTRRNSPSSESAFDRYGDQARPSTRDTSTNPDSRYKAFDPRNSTNDSDPRLARSDSRGTMYRGRTGVLYPEMRTLRDPDPQAFSFPTQDKEPLPYGAVIKATPLQNSHYNCFQRHRFMKRSLNRNYPLTCQTCDREDTEDRFSCSFCHLRICESCSRSFDGQKRNLQKLVDAVQGSQAATLSLSSPSRPGSALGLTYA